MRLPVWLTLGVALLVCVFGAYRIRIAFRSDEEDQRARERKGLYAMGRRTHLLIGIVYLLLGAGLIATTFGWNPLGSMFGPRTERPARDAAPSKPGSVPVDQLPPAPANPAAPSPPSK
ncbi:MAG TPA: hypothetical protein VHT91_14995 [Kofleriaceae bacterium]|jgi:hypothetical protein|nr:hypothetical protein [Kofleriaceae bacterium]